MNKLERLKLEIIEDHRSNNYKEGRLSLTDKTDTNNYPDYKAAVNALNADTDFPYTVYILFYSNVIKISYQPLGAKFYEYKQPSEVITVLERLTDYVKRLDREKNISHSTYIKEDKDTLHILVESLTGGESLAIDITNTFKKFNE